MLDKITTNPDSHDLDHSKPHILIASWFKSGFLLPAPGTWGSLAAIPPGLLILWIGGTGLLTIAIISIFIIGTWAARKFGQETGTHDSPMIVVDEVLGMWLPLLITGFSPILILLAFIFFRFFDIVKLWPASFFDQKIKNAFGVMMDDVFAGLYATLLILLFKGIFGL